ncbi:MAG: hypothetical protein H7Y89_19445, partial [Steroidobacteraceae bacterium]|nr:hypothetical protein [Steroidobacteraceae bacterium]
ASRAALPLVLSPAVLAAAVTVEDVGDADSFGKNVTYLGIAQSIGITLTDDCTGTDPLVERCTVQNAAPAFTTVIENDLAVINLPPKATKTLMCFTLTPSIFVDWANFTGSQQMARFNATALISIENPVLADPALVDPATGLPFNGVLEIGLTTWHHLQTMPDNSQEQERSMQTRSCIAGLISRRVLVDDYGLTDAQAKEFFKKAMSVRFGARVTAAMSQYTNYFYGVRLYGD